MTMSTPSIQMMNKSVHPNANRKQRNQRKCDKGRGVSNKNPRLPQKRKMFKMKPKQCNHTKATGRNSCPTKTRRRHRALGVYKGKEHNREDKHREKERKRTLGSNYDLI